MKITGKQLLRELQRLCNQHADQDIPDNRNCCDCPLCSICNGFRPTDIVLGDDQSAKHDDLFADITQAMNWISVKENLPAVGKRVLATDGQVVGEAYLTAIGSEKFWHRAFNVPWESWSRNLPVIAWTELPTYEVA